MTKAAFKEAFLTKCAEEGLTIEETELLAEKLLNRFQEKKAAGGALSTALNALLSTGKFGVGALALGPPLIGGAGGYMLGGASVSDEKTPLEIRKQELLEEYRRAREALEASRRARTRRTRADAKPGGYRL